MGLPGDCHIYFLIKDKIGKYITSDLSVWEWKELEHRHHPVFLFRIRGLFMEKKDLQRHQSLFSCLKTLAVISTSRLTGRVFSGTQEFLGNVTLPC